MFQSEADGSVTNLIHQIKQGDSQAAGELWRRYFEKLSRIARSRMKERFSPLEDEEDVALSVLDTLFRNAKNGRFPELRDRHDLWGLLMVILRQKAISQYRHSNRLKRGSGQVRNITDLQELIHVELDLVYQQEPTSETIVMLEDLCDSLLRNMNDPVMRSIATLKLENLSNREIAKRLGLVPRTVDRKVVLIQEKWLREFELLYETDNDTERTNDNRY